MAQWRILDLLNYQGEIAASDGHLNAGGKSVALSDVAVVMLGTKCVVHSSLWDRAAAFDVMVLLCDWRGIPLSTMLPWSHNTRVGARHIAQANLGEGRRKNAWKQIVKAKIRGQALNLEPQSGPRFALERLAKEVRSGDSANIEAQAARTYWQHVFSADTEFERNTDALHDQNTFLNYGYTVLRGHVIRHIVAAGLWPTLGLWHRNRSNAFALADDLIEPFRCVVDSVVQELPAESTLKDPQVKAALVSAGELTFRTDGSKTTTAIAKLAQSYAQYVEGDIDKLSVDVWQGRQ